MLQDSTQAQTLSTDACGFTDLIQRQALVTISKIQVTVSQQSREKSVILTQSWGSPQPQQASSAHINSDSNPRDVHHCHRGAPSQAGRFSIKGRESHSFCEEIRDSRDTVPHRSQLHFPQAVSPAQTISPKKHLACLSGTPLGCLHRDYTKRSHGKRQKELQTYRFICKPPITQRETGSKRKTV